jgi:hypothetical protein
VFTANSSQKAFAPSKTPPLFRQKGTQSCLEICTQTTVAKLKFSERERPAYTRFQSLVEIFFSCRKSCKRGSQTAGIAVFVTFSGDEHRTRRMSTDRTKLAAGSEPCKCRATSQKNLTFNATDVLRLGLLHERRPELKRVRSSACSVTVTPLFGEPHALPTRSRTMSGSSRNGFTWKEVADVLRVSQVSDSASLRREIKGRKKRRIAAKRTPVATNGAQRTSEQVQLRRPGASR